MKLLPLLLCAALPLAAAAAPDALPTAPPPGASLAFTLAARGVQIYECREQAWAFVAPEAVLLDTQDRVVGTHGAGPTWQLNDGSRIGGRVQARVEAPGGREIPWLLLAAQAEPSAPGSLTGISHIQRLNTRGGLAPSGACVNQQSARVAYTADYLFFRSPDQDAPASAEQRLRSAIDAYLAAWARRDVDALPQFHTEDTLYIDPYLNEKRGRGQLAGYLAAMMGLYDLRLDIERMVVRSDGTQALVILRERYGELPRKDGRYVRDFDRSGIFSRWGFRDGAWRIEQFVDSTTRSAEFIKAEGL